MKYCINCGRPNKNIYRGYCPECIAGKKIPVHSGYTWHSIVKKKDKIIAELKNKFKVSEAK